MTIFYTILIILIAGVIALQIVLLTKRNNTNSADEKANYEKQIHDLQMEHERRYTELIDRMEMRVTNALSGNTEKLKQENAEQISLLLNPLKENLEGFKKVVSDCYVTENAQRKSLSDQIDRLMQLNSTIGEEARNLTSALRHNSKTQGDWGEMVLESLLENAGLTPGVHFIAQMTRDGGGNVIRDAEGAQKRPDVVVLLPDNRRMVIDSKVSLNAYIDYCAAETDSAKREAGKRHLDSVRAHIKELGDKSYQRDIDGSAEYVMMFIPNEGAYLTALQMDTDLWQYAYNRHVALVSPTHLFSVMKIISQLWTQDAQNRNVLAIAKKGGDFYNKLATFAEEFTKVERAINQASDAYASAYKLLVTGRGNVIRQAEMLKDLGVTASKQLPRQMVEDSDTDASALLE